jgi:hypothetical protein
LPDGFNPPDESGRAFGLLQAARYPDGASGQTERSSNDPRGSARLGGGPLAPSGPSSFGAGGIEGCPCKPVARTREIAEGPPIGDGLIPPWTRLEENAVSEFEDNMRIIIRRIS